MIVDGREQDKYDDTGNLVFSPDSKRLAYRARRGRSMFAVIDGRVSIPTILSSARHRSLVSPDGTRVAYLASKRE